MTSQHKTVCGGRIMLADRTPAPKLLQQVLSGLGSSAASVPCLQSASSGSSRSSLSRQGDGKWLAAAGRRLLLRTTFLKAFPLRLFTALLNGLRTYGPFLRRLRLPLPTATLGWRPAFCGRNCAQPLPFFFGQAGAGGCVTRAGKKEPASEPSQRMCRLEPAQVDDRR